MMFPTGSALVLKTDLSFSASLSFVHIGSGPCITYRLGRIYVISTKRSQESRRLCLAVTWSRRSMLWWSYILRNCAYDELVNATGDITDDNLWRPTRRAKEHCTKDKLSTRRGAVHSIGWLCRPNLPPTASSANAGTDLARVEL